MALTNENGSRSADNPLSVIVAAHEHTDPRPSFSLAIALAVAARGDIEIVDVRGSSNDGVELRVRSELESWGLLPPGSSREDVAKVGIRVKKIVKRGGEEHEIRKRLLKNDHDILVIGTETREGLPALFGGDLAGHLANRCRQTTLFVPSTARSIVDPGTGRLLLNRILVPVVADPPVQPAISFLQRLVSCLGLRPAEIVGLHIGESFPAVDLSLIDAMPWSPVLVPPGRQSVPEHIAAIAEDGNVDLIISSTNGRDTLPQRIMGSITEQTVKRSPCPVLAVAVT